MFDRASSGGLIDPAYGYCAKYLAEPRNVARDKTVTYRRSTLQLLPGSEWT